MDDLLTGHRKQMEALLAEGLRSETSTPRRIPRALPSPPPSSPINFGTSSGAGPSTIRKPAQSILALTDLTVIEKMPPPRKRKASKEPDNSVKRRKVGDVDLQVYDVIELSD
ncbi:hypothetical protein K435DRAFT_871015 [Dendrothele bispora CBS 962.96]|uniref:Uncharacterized protein n=1 Tax=Dendrothele bispora (strain CBS 962.96) TaxID=1314807 RepID=A0A4S8L572_DENBC|nr:hypothetical protein K435DRAFT_871015 [Dendrothele bispora CBS 962.96]